MLGNPAAGLTTLSALVQIVGPGTVGLLTDIVRKRIDDQGAEKLDLFDYKIFRREIAENMTRLAADGGEEFRKKYPLENLEEWLK